MTGPIVHLVQAIFLIMEDAAEETLPEGFWGEEGNVTINAKQFQIFLDRCLEKMKEETK